MTDVIVARAETRDKSRRSGDLAVARALGRVEFQRMALNPLIGLGLALSALANYMFIGRGAGQLSNDDGIIGLLAFPLAGMTLIAVNLCVLRGRRHGAEELFESLPVRPHVRTAAHAISVLAPAIYAVVLGLGATVISRLSGGIGWPHPTEIATGAVLVLAAGMVGILLARIVPRSAAAPFFVIGIGFMEGAMAASIRFQWKRLAPFMPISDEPTEVWFRPRGAHLLYLLGICAVLIAVAELIHRRSVRVLVVLSVGIAVTISAAIAQSPFPSAADESRFAAWVEHPEGVQPCSRHAGVAYCAYPGYDQLIPRWRAPVEGVLALAPDSVRTRSLLIRQRVPSERVQLLRPTLRAALSFPVAPDVPFWWPDDGAIHPDLHWCETGLRRARCEMILGNTVAAWVVGLPLVRVGPPATQQAQAAGTVPFEALINQGLYDSSGQARAVVALWLTIEATPRTRTASPSFDASLSRYPMNTCSATGEGPESSVTWSLLDTGYARRLAELPVADVTARLRSRWSVVTDPHTTTAQLAKLMNLPSPSVEMLRPLAINEGC